MFSVLFFCGCWPKPKRMSFAWLDVSCMYPQSVIAVPQITQDGVDRFLLGVAIKAMPAAGQYEELSMIVAVLCTL